jgi:hypothetical protein
MEVLHYLLRKFPPYYSTLKAHTHNLQVWIFLELLFVCFLYVETRGPTLEEVAKIFDGEDAEVARIDVEKFDHGATSGFEKEAGTRVERVST